jgi:hypothetical protein
VSIRLPASGLAFRIDMGNVQINQLAGDRQQLWALPTFEGYPQHDLGGAALGTPLPGKTTLQPPPGGVLPASYPAYPSTGYPESAHYSAPPNVSGATTTNGPRYQPLPQYGRPEQTAPSVMRR